jgi:hypothetical protein
MIRIRPTTASGLSHVVYAIDLPGDISPIKPRTKKVATTIDGGVAITLFPKKIAGSSIQKNFVLHPEKYEILKAIVYHATVFEWLVLSDEKRFVCEVDIIKDEKQTVLGNPDYHNVDVTFLVTEENIYA